MYLHSTKIYKIHTNLQEKLNITHIQYLNCFQYIYWRKHARFLKSITKYIQIKHKQNIEQKKNTKNVQNSYKTLKKDYIYSTGKIKFTYKHIQLSEFFQTFTRKNLQDF